MSNESNKWQFLLYKLTVIMKNPETEHLMVRLG